MSRVPSGKTSSSDFIYLRYKDAVLTQIIDEECEKLKKQELLRTKRGIGKTMSSSIVKLGKKAVRVVKPSVKLFKTAGKYSEKFLKAGLKHAPFDIGLDLLEIAIDSKWNVLDAVKTDEDGDKSEEVAANASLEIENQIEEFRNDLRILLNSSIIQGYIQKTSSIQKISMNNFASELKASNVKCVKDDFTTIYSLRLRIDIEEQIPVLARRCSDIGVIYSDENSQEFYEYYDISNNFLVERNGITYAVDTKKCLHDTYSYCPEISLRKEACSVQSTQYCNKTIRLLQTESTVKRNLPIGFAYYGPYKKLALKRNKKVVKFLINPFHLEYIRLSEGDEIQIGNDVFQA